MTIIARKTTKNFAVILNAVAGYQWFSLEEFKLLVYLHARLDDRLRMPRISVTSAILAAIKPTSNRGNLTTQTISISKKSVNY